MTALSQALDLSMALKERAKSMLSSAPSANKDETHKIDSKIKIEGYESFLPFNPELCRRWYKNLSQDILDETHSPLLRTSFEYQGAILHSARILSDGVTHVSVFNAQNQLQTAYTAHYRLKPLNVLKRQPNQLIKGTTLHLCAPIATLRGNFAHWLLDGMARWILLNDRATENVEIDNYLIPANKPELRECLVVLGVADKQIIELSINETMEFEKLACISRPRGYSSNVAPGWLIDGYRKRLDASMSPSDKASLRLYISRRDAGSRKFREEETLVEELEQRGFQTVELSKLGFREKAALFSQAKEVVGLTGAGMMSIMFCPPGTRIIELYPSNFVTYLYATIAAFLNHEHQPYIFTNTSKKGILSRHSGEFDLDINDFLKSLDAFQVS